MLFGWQVPLPGISKPGMDQNAAAAAGVVRCPKPFQKPNLPGEFFRHPFVIGIEEGDIGSDCRVDPGVARHGGRGAVRVIGSNAQRSTGVLFESSSDTGPRIIDNDNLCSVKVWLRRALITR